MRINGELLDRLGVYFIHMKINERYGVTFEKFVERCQRGTWEL